MKIISFCIDIEEEVLREFFSECGEIQSVRCVRDQSTNIGVGIGFVNFKEASSVPLALKMKTTPFEGRQLRIKKYSASEQNKSKKRKQKEETKIVHKKSLAKSTHTGEIPKWMGKISAKEGSEFKTIKKNAKKRKDRTPGGRNYKKFVQTNNKGSTQTKKRTTKNMNRTNYQK